MQKCSANGLLQIFPLQTKRMEFIWEGKYGLLIVLPYILNIYLKQIFITYLFINY
jgi:hypothetical protein